MKSRQMKGFIALHFATLHLAHSYNGHSDERQTVIYNLDHSESAIATSEEAAAGMLGIPF